MGESLWELQAFKKHGYFMLFHPYNCSLCIEENKLETDLKERKIKNFTDRFSALTRLLELRQWVKA